MEQKLTLKDNISLAMLAKLTEKTTTELKHRIINKLIEAEIVFPDMEFCGETIEEITELWDDKGMTAVTLFTLEKSTPQIEKLFSELVIWGIENECPECGCKLEYEKYGMGKFKVEKEDCVNCDYSFTNEPDDNN